MFSLPSAFWDRPKTPVGSKSRSEKYFVEDGVLQVPIVGERVELHSEEYVCLETAINYVESMVETFTLKNDVLIGKCPCAIKEEDTFLEKTCTKEVDIQKVLKQIPAFTRSILQKKIASRKERSARKELLNAISGAVDCIFCVDPVYDSGIGTPLELLVKDKKTLRKRIFRKNYQNCKQCNTCGKIWCHLCKTEYLTEENAHDYLTCDDVKRVKGGEDPSAVLVKSTSKVCPGCHADVHRTKGCNHMTCRCGTEFCYKCGSGYEINEGDYYCPGCNAYL